MLSPAQIDAYHERGYVVPDYRLSDDTLAEIRAQHTRLIGKHAEFSDYCPALLAFDAGFLNYARDPQILDMVEQLIGADFALWNSSFFAKPAHTGRKTPWHQDGEYWPIRPLATCSVWIAVDDANVDNGCLKFLPGSHRHRALASHHHNDASNLALPLELDAQHVDESRAEPLILEAGQMSLHDIFLMHGSEANDSDQPRRGMTLRFMPTTSVYRRDLAAGGERRAAQLAMAQRTLYLMRGTDRSGANDFRVRC